MYQLCDIGFMAVCDQHAVVRARKKEQVFHQTCCPVGGLVDAPEVISTAVGRKLIDGSKLGGTFNDGEGASQLMGCIPDEATLLLKLRLKP